MKNSDMKIIAIILSIALFLTIVTSNAVSIASVVFLAKGQTVQEGTVGDNADGTATTPSGSTSTTPSGSTSSTPSGSTSSTPSGSTSTTPSGSTSSTPSGSTSSTPSGSTSTSTPSGSTSTTPDANKPAEDANKPAEDANKPAEDANKPAEDANKPAEDANKPANDANKPAEDANKPAEDANKPAGLKELSAQDALKMFQDAATDIKTNASASYNCKAWQVVKEMNIGNDTLANLIAGFVTSEEKAETKVNAKGTDDSKNRMPASNCTMNAVQNISTQVSGSNYIITIVMKDQINPTAEDTDGIALMSRDLLYMKAVTETIETNSAIKLIVKGLNKAEMNYQAFTITATMTADGKFVEITHKCDAKLTAEAALTLGGTLGGDGVLEFNARFWDFQY